MHHAHAHASSGTHVASLMTIETVTEPMAAELRRHGYRLLCGMQGDECWVHQSAVLGPAALSRIVDCGGAGMRCEPVVASVRQQAARRRPNATGWECQDLSPRIRMQWLHAKPTKAGRIRDAGADLRARAW